MTNDRKDILDFARAELKYPRSNVVEQLCRLALEQEAELERLRKPLATNSNVLLIGTKEMPTIFPTVESVVREHVWNVLHALDGNKSRAARILGISRRSLYRWIERMAEPPAGGPDARQVGLGEKPSNPDPIGLHSMVEGNRE